MIEVYKYSHGIYRNSVLELTSDTRTRTQYTTGVINLQDDSQT